MPTNYQDFMPVEAARRVITAAREGSVILGSGATVKRMAAGQERLPLRTVNPVAEFVSAIGGRKPLTSVVYEQESLVPEEIALTVAIPDAFLNDATFDVDADLEEAFATAIAKALDLAVIAGTGAPTGWFNAGGLLGLAGGPFAPSTGAGTTIADVLAEAFEYVEDADGEPTDVLASSRLKGALRRHVAAANDGGLLVDPSDAFGVDITSTRHWPADPTADGLVADMSGVIVGIREDIRIRKSQDAILQNADGTIAVNAFQDDSTAYRAYMRVGVAVPGKPTGEAEGALQYPFAGVETTATA